jgi:hypothetical protein
MAKKATLSEEDQLLLASVATKPTSVDRAWSQLCDTLETRFADDPDGLAAIQPALIKSLNKWSKLYQRAPKRWLADAERLGHLLCVSQHLILYESDGLSAALPAALACPMPRLRTIELHGFAVPEAAFTALAQNPSLTSVTSIKLSATGLTDDGLAALLKGEALWSGLTTLMISEPRVRTKGAQLLADSPRVASLNVLSLKGCPIGDAGRRALGASAHLSDRAKGRARAKIIASNEAVAEAPPAPRDLFGDLRSALQSTPSTLAWDRVCDMFDRLQHSPERERVQQELLPYAQSSLARWPDALRVAPSTWIEQLMDGAPAHAGLRLAARLELRSAVRADRLKRLATSDALPALTDISFQDNTVSPKALTTLLDSPLRTQLTSLQLRCTDQRDGLISVLTSPKGPTSLERLELARQEVSQPAVQELATAPFAASLRHIRLESNARHGGQLAALLRAPFAPQLQTLCLHTGTISRDDSDAIELPALTALSIESSGGSADVGSSLRGLIERSPLLEALSLRGHMVSTGSFFQQLLDGPLPSALRSLALDAVSWMRGVDQAKRNAWLGALPASLRELDLIGSYNTRDDHTLAHALFASPRGATLTALRLRQQTLNANMLRANPVALPTLQALSIQDSTIDDQDIKALASHAELPALRALKLSEHGASLDALARLTQTPWWPSLRALTFSARYQQHAPTHSSPALLRALLPATLESLDLSFMPIDHAALDAILASPAARSLRRLCLAGSFTQPGALSRIVEALPSLPSLEQLDLSNNLHQFTDDELIALAGAPDALRLHRITLSGKLPIKAMRALMESNNLLLSTKEHLQRPLDASEAW